MFFGVSFFSCVLVLLLVHNDAHVSWWFVFFILCFGVVTRAHFALMCPCVPFQQSP